MDKFLKEPTQNINLLNQIIPKLMEQNDVKQLHEILECLEKFHIDFNDTSKISNFIKQRLCAYFESLAENTDNFGVFEELMDISKQYDIGKQFLAKRGMSHYPKKFKMQYLD